MIILIAILDLGLVGWLILAVPTMFMIAFVLHVLGYELQ